MAAANQFAVFGRRVQAGWRNHTQQILVGLSAAAIAQMAVQGVWQYIAKTAVPQSRQDYEHILGLRDHLLNANNAIYVAVMIWWIVCLWIDEPGAALTAEIAPEGTESASVEEPPPTIE